MVADQFGGVRFGRVGARLRLGPAARLAVRSFRRRPASALAAVVTLALGIGAASTIYAVLHGFTRPLPVPDGAEVVQIRTLSAHGGSPVPAGADALSGWADAPVLSAVGAFQVTSPVVAPEGDAPVRVSAAVLSPEVLPLLGVRPLRGRLPRAATDDEPVEVLVGSGSVEALFPAGGSVLGKTLVVENRPAIVVGVMPEGFGFPYHQAFWWVSSELGRSSEATASKADGGELELVGRVAPGVARSTAADQLTARLDRVRHERAPGTDPARVEVLGFTRDRGEGGEVVALSALLGLVLLLVLVSTANVANLLLTRAEERAHLLTVHAALGAGPGQVALQLLGEALLLSLAGAALGLAGGGAAVAFIQRTLAANWGYFWMRVSLDPSVVAFALVLAVVLAVMSGAAPALSAMRPDLSTSLRAASPGSGRRSGRSSLALLTAQIGFSAAALVMALVMAAGLVRLSRAGEALPGRALVMGSVTLDAGRYGQPAARTDVRRRLLESLRRTGARDAVLSTGIPGFRSETATVGTEGAESPPESPTRVAVFGITPSFFHAFGATLLQGRLLREGDGGGEDPAAVVSPDLAAQAFPDGRVVGGRLRLSDASGHDTWYRVVGVATIPYRGDARPRWVWVPIDTRDPSTFFVALRAARGDGLSLGAALRNAVHSADPELTLDPSMVGTPVYSLGQMLAYVGRFYRTSGLLALLGAVGAVLVALLGVYGVLALDVRRHTRDLGVRMALGAARGEVAADVLRRGLGRVVPGLALGLGIAWAAAPVFGLFAGGANPRDPRLLGASAAAYLIAVLLAVAPTALRASRVDPAAILRDDG